MRKVEEILRMEYDVEKRLGLMGIGIGVDSGGVIYILDVVMIVVVKV